MRSLTGEQLLARLLHLKRTAPAMLNETVVIIPSEEVTTVDRFYDSGVYVERAFVDSEGGLIIVTQGEE